MYLMWMDFQIEVEAGVVQQPEARPVPLRISQRLQRDLFHRVDQSERTV